jgi:hypothetical protein
MFCKESITIPSIKYQNFCRTTGSPCFNYLSPDCRKCICPQGYADRWVDLFIVVFL